MRSQLLRDIDNFSMAQSIEVRSPFLDHELFARILMLDKEYKYDGKRMKPLLQDLVPTGIPNCVPKAIKRGFTFPLDKWLKKGLEKKFREVVFDNSNIGIWNNSKIDEIWRSYKKGKLHWSVPWTIYTYSMWLRSR